MAEYYYEGAQILAPFQILSNQPTYDSDTISLKKQRGEQGYQRWELSFNCLANDNMADLLVSSTQSAGSSTPSTMIMPQLKEVTDLNTLAIPDSYVWPTTSATLTQPVVHTTVAANAASVVIYNSNAINGILKKGNFVKFSNHDKIYLVTADASFSPVGNVTLNLYPKLRSPVPSGSILQLGSSALLSYHRKIDNIQGIVFTDGILSNVGTVDLSEAL